MKNYILLMHNDGDSTDSEEWTSYFTNLNQSGNFQGGSSIGDGTVLSKSGTSKPITGFISGYIKIQADDLEHACRLVKGNPVFEAGGTVEIRELLPS